MKTLLAAIILTLVPVKLKEPTLKRAYGSVYHIINPLLTPVTVTIECGADFDPLTIKVPAGAKQELDIRQPDGLAGACSLQSWKLAP